MRRMVEGIFGREIADLTGDFWGLDDQGEIKGAFVPTGREYLLKTIQESKTERLIVTDASFVVVDPAFWYLGGTLGGVRYYSRFIALQIKARLLGTPLKVYEEDCTKREDGW